MRRTHSILIALVLQLILGFGPALSAIPAGALTSAQSGWSGKVDESRLPACCRRNGLHHCTMHAGETAKSSPQLQLEERNHDSFAKVTAPDCCPYTPRTLATLSPQSSIISSSGLNSFEAPPERLLAFANHNFPSSSKQRTRPKRGPPSSASL